MTGTRLGREWFSGLAWWLSEFQEHPIGRTSKLRQFHMTQLFGTNVEIREVMEVVGGEIVHMSDHVLAISWPIGRSGVSCSLSWLRTCHKHTLTVHEQTSKSNPRSSEEFRGVPRSSEEF